MKRISIFIFVVLAMMLVFVASVSAGSITKNGMTLTWPDYPLTGLALQSCEPWEDPTADDLILEGIPAGSSVWVRFAYASPYEGGPIFLAPMVYDNVTADPFIIPIVYPMNTMDWPVYDSSTNERAIAVAGFIHVTAPDGTLTKFVAKQWWVRCLPPLPPLQGCTPGYWRQDQHFDSWQPTGYVPGDDFETVFGVDASFDPHTMLDAVWLGGGGENALARHAVAALLNASHPDVDYAYTAAEVIAGVQNAYATGDFEPFKTDLDFANNAGCPLN